MKYFFTPCLLLCSIILYAQNNSVPDTAAINKARLQSIKPINNNPNINVTPAINTTVTKNQPASIPTNNSNPTTGTIISLKSNKNSSKTSKLSANPGSDTLPLLTRKNTSLTNSRTKPANRKPLPKKKEAAVKKVNQ